MAHWSDCAVHNEPAYPNGPCDCGNDAPSTELEDEQAAEKGPITQPGGVQVDDEAAFEAEVDDMAKDQP